MTKEAYFEMCEVLETEPVPEEIPIEFSDLHSEVQEAYLIFNMLQDTYNAMSGTYTGKSYSGIVDIMTLYEVDDPKHTFSLIKTIDYNKIKHSSERAMQESKITKKPP